MIADTSNFYNFALFNGRLLIFTLNTVTYSNYNKTEILNNIILPLHRTNCSFNTKRDACKLTANKREKSNIKCTFCILSGEQDET